jgi:hypothetical protein
MKQTAKPKKKDNCCKEPRGIKNNKSHSNWTIHLGKTLENPRKYENEKALFGKKGTEENDVLL